MDTNITKEDRAFVTVDYNITGEIVGLLSEIGSRQEKFVLYQIMFCKYLNYDTSKGFHGQFLRNMARLKYELARLAFLK